MIGDYTMIGDYDSLHGPIMPLRTAPDEVWHHRHPFKKPSRTSISTPSSTPAHTHTHAHTPAADAALCSQALHKLVQYPGPRRVKVAQVLMHRPAEVQDLRQQQQQTAWGLGGYTT